MNVTISFDSFKSKLAAGIAGGTTFGVSLAGLTGTTGTTEQAMNYLIYCGFVGGVLSTFVYLSTRVGTRRETEARRKWDSLSAEEQRTITDLLDKNAKK